MTKISDALTYGLTIRESATDGSDFTNPVADYRRLFLGEDGLLHVKDSAGTVTMPTGGIADQGLATFLDFDGAAAPANPTGDHARIYAKTDGRIYSRDAGGVEYGPFDAAGAGAGNDYDDDFAAATLDAKWTELGGANLTTLNTTDTAGQVHMAKTSIGYAACGIHQAAPTPPFVAAVKIAAWTMGANYEQVGIMLADSTPTKLTLFGPLYGGYGAGVNDICSGAWTNRTTRASAADSNAAGTMTAPFWVGVSVSPISGASWLYSTNGTTWTASHVGALGYTVGKVGLFVAGNTAGGNVSAYFEGISFGIMPTIA